MTAELFQDLIGSVDGERGDVYLELAPLERSPPPAPDFSFGPVPIELRQFFDGKTAVYPAGCVTLRDAGVCGDGFPIRNGIFLTHHAAELRPSYIGSRIGSVPPAKTRREAGTGVCLSGPGYLTYGHWLVDIIPKLFVLEKIGCELGRARFAIPANTPSFGLEWLEMLGIPQVSLVPYHPKNEIVQFEKVVLPLPLRADSRACNLFAPAMKMIQRMIGELPVAGPQPPERIYLSRQESGRHARRLVNAPQVEDIARAHGYAVVHPERMTLREQIAMFRGARLLVGEYGSAMHGSIFAPPDCVVCTIRGTELEPGFLQSGLCQVLGQPLGYVFGRTERTAAQMQQTTVEETDVRAAFAAADRLADPARRAATDGTGDRPAPKPPAPMPRTSELEWLFHDTPHRVCRKWTHYFRIYERFLARFRDKPGFRMLEIGIAQGGSLDLWRAYFGPDPLIVGIDIDPRCAGYQSGRTQVRIGSQSDPAFLAQIVAEFGHFDFILDDGGHRMEQQKTAFEVLYPMVPPGGVYMVEDCHTSYHGQFGGGYRKPGTFIELAKEMIDQLNGFHVHTNPELVTPFTRTTSSLSFFDSIVAFEKDDIICPRMVEAGEGS